MMTAIQGRAQPSVVYPRLWREEDPSLTVGLLPLRYRSGF